MPNLLVNLAAGKLRLPVPSDLQTPPAPPTYTVAKLKTY